MKRRMICVFSCVHLAGSTLLSFGQQPSIPTELTLQQKSMTERVQKIIPPKKFPRLQAGIVLMSTKSGKILFQRGADTKLIPASVSKIFTSYAALKKLKPSFTFKTKILHSGTISKGKLSGDLYVRGEGDPSLVSERMWMMANDFARKGIKRVMGKIVVDSSYFDSETNPESRPKYLKDQAYNAPVGAFSFNFNTTTIFVNPAETAGQPPKVYTDPENSYIDIVNQAKTSSAGTSNTIQVSRTEYVEGDIGDTVLLRGSIPLKAREMRFYRNIVNPALYAGHMLKTFLDQRSIYVEGSIEEGKIPASASELIEFESLPLWQIVWGLNKFSNNFVADQIMKKLGAQMWGAPGTLQKGLATVQDALEDLGINKDSYHIADGSGLTRETRVTAKQIGTVLVAARKDFSIAPEFMASLGISGEDGTLRSRLPTSSEDELIRAKTGSLDGVSSLAGYISAKDGELLAFAVVLNDPTLKYGRMSGWVDQIARGFREIW